MSRHVHFLLRLSCHPLIADRNNANDAKVEGEPSVGRHSIHNAQSFFSWFHDVKGVNVNVPGTLELTLSEDGDV